MNITNISEHHICTACGACALVCPKDAVTLEETPAGFLTARVSDACVDCGLCRKVCPSVAENTTKYAPEDLLHGPFLSAFTGWATDETLRQTGQSGGLVTALLCHILDTNQADGALVAGFAPPPAVQKPASSIPGRISWPPPGPATPSAPCSRL